MTDLPDDTKIYRIYSFSDLINTLHQNKIRMSQVSRMEDKNELFGLYFDLIKSSFGARSLEDIPKWQKNFNEAQAYHYITCWTQTKDNIAVWSLYSPEQNGIQACTTYGRLKSAIMQHWKNNGTHNAYSLEPNDPQDLFFLPQIGAVEYIRFSEESEAIKASYEEYFEEQGRFWEEQREAQSETGTKNLFDGVDEGAKMWVAQDRERRKRIFGEPNDNGALLKDCRYTHEEEVRFVLSLYRRDSRTKAQYEAHPMAGLDGPYRHPKPADCPENIFIPFTPDNFTSFEVDGRMSSWEYEAVQHSLSSFGFDVGRSNAFSQIEI